MTCLSITSRTSAVNLQSSLGVLSEFYTAVRFISRVTGEIVRLVW